MDKQTNPDLGLMSWRDHPVNQRPGFLIRRLNQIHTALFNDACSGARISPIMYSVLSALAQSGPVDQTSLARNIAVNKTNMVNLMERMRERGLITRGASPEDRRVRLVLLTDAGLAMLDEIDARACQAHLRTLEDLTPEQRDMLLALIAKIVDAKGSILDF